MQLMVFSAKFENALRTISASFLSCTVDALQVLHNWYKYGNAGLAKIQNMLAQTKLSIWPSCFLDPHRRQLHALLQAAPTQAATSSNIPKPTGIVGYLP